MASNGLLEFQGTNKAIFVGTNSNIVLDTVTSSLGIGVDVDGPTSNLHVVGNAYVSTELTVTGNAYVSSNLEVTGNTTFTGNLIKTNGYTQIHDKTRLLNGEASFYDADNVLRTGRRTILEINVNAPNSSNTAQREYTGYIDIEMISQRTVAGYNTSSGGYVGRLNFVMSYTTYPSSIWEYSFIQEVKAYNPGTGSNGMVGNAPILRYKLDNATKKLQFFLEFTYQRIEAHFTWAVRMSCDSLDDVSIPSPDSEMSQGTLTTAPIGVSYNETGNVGIGTSSPTTALEISRNFTTDGDKSAMISFTNTATGYHEWQIGPTIYSGNAGFGIKGGADGFGNISDIIAINNTDVGIGTANPIGNLHIKQNDNDYYSQNAGLRLEANGTTSMWAIVASSYSSQSGTLAFGSSSNGAVTWADRAYISHVGNQNQLDFTGQHRAFIEGVSYSDYETLEGLIVSANKNKYYNIDEEITTGASAIQVSQSLPLVSMSTTEKDKSCFGVISGSEDPETREYTQGSFVSVMKKQVGDIRAFINSVGEGAIWVTNINGPLESGDYITTSNVAGYGQKQDSEFLANYTVAKITMDCDFSPVTQPIQNIKKDETGENTLDEHGQIQWEDHPTETEKAYKIRHLDANGVITDEANVVHTAAFVGCTYHCG